MSHLRSLLLCPSDVFQVLFNSPVRWFCDLQKNKMFVDCVVYNIYIKGGGGWGGAAQWLWRVVDSGGGRCPVLPERGVQSRSNQQHGTQRLALGSNHDLGLKLGLLDLVSHLQGHVDHRRVARAPAWNVKHVRVDLPLYTHTSILIYLCTHTPQYWSTSVHTHLNTGWKSEKRTCWSTSVHTHLNTGWQPETWNAELTYLCPHTPEHRVATWNTMLIYLCPHTPEYRVATWNTVLIYLCSHTLEYRVAVRNVKTPCWYTSVPTHTWIPGGNVKHRVDLLLSTHSSEYRVATWNPVLIYLCPHTSEHRVAMWNTVLIYFCPHTPQYRVAIRNVKRRVDQPLSTHTWIPGGRLHVQVVHNESA